MTRPGTLGELRASGWVSRPVKEEVRANAIARIAEGKPLVDGVIGYEDTVLPQLENALIAGHDVIFLGERGQAKTRMIRSLTDLLDEWMPIVAGSEINDDPYNPISQHARLLVAERGDEAPIEWVHRDRRFGEKLATPDTSIADLIGEVDPIKVAEGRYLSDELTIHYGLVPRTNRGIFSINELPDLAERIQVGLLNVLEERDVQIRGYKIRLPLDLMLVASANPEDYTNRGRIITPLKDRFGAQIRTHYPLDAELEAAVVEQEAHPLTADGLNVQVPDVHDRDRRRDEPAGAPLTAHQPAIRCVGAPLDRQLRDPRRQRAAARCATARPRSCPRERPRSARREHRGQGRVRDRRRRPRGAGARPHRQGVGARDVPCPHPARRSSPSSSPRSKAGSSCTPAKTSRRRSTPSSSPTSRRCATLADLDVGETPAGVASAVEFVLEGSAPLRSASTRTAVGGRAAYRGRGRSHRPARRPDGPAPPRSRSRRRRGGSRSRLRVVFSGCRPLTCRRSPLRCTRRGTVAASCLMSFGAWLGDGVDQRDLLVEGGLLRQAFVVALRGLAECRARLRQRGRGVARAPADDGGECQDGQQRTEHTHRPHCGRDRGTIRRSEGG